MLHCLLNFTLAVFWLAVSVSSVHALDHEPILFGHNLTPTPYTLKKGSASAGTYALTYGITDDWMFGTSPWIVAGYGMPMLETRYRLLNQNKFEIAGELMGFVTWKGSRYNQESVFLRFTGCYHFSKTYTLHLSTGNQYFWNATAPYSLNPWPGHRDYIASLTAMHEFNFLEMYGALFEMGILGLNYFAPERHIGASVFYKNTWLLVQLGISETRSTKVNEEGYEHWVTHPETQIQFYFDL